MPTPRLDHNALLCKQFAEKFKLTARYPKVTSQAETLPLETSKLVAFGYNPSILAVEGGLMMAYRYHEGTSLATRLAVAELDNSGKVISNRSIDVDDNRTSAEDPKLFWRRGEVWISWIQSTWPVLPLSSVVKYGKLEGNKVVNIHQPRLPAPKTLEKNWVPITMDDALFFIYESEPCQNVLEVENSNIVAEHKSEAPLWPYGSIRGGSVPLWWEEKKKLIRFFHSNLDNEWGTEQRRRYFIGASIMDATPPFRTISVSATPIVYGSELDDIRSAERERCHQYKRQVVFPGGAVERDAHFLVSVGINDSACAILKIDPKSLNFV